MTWREASSASQKALGLKISPKFPEKCDILNLNFQAPEIHKQIPVPVYNY